MAESTVSGPFRSENGFQQLDENGVWVPVTGGGGGGVTSIIAGSGISVSSPTGAVTISASGSNTALIVPRATGAQLNYTLPAPTQVGQIYTLELAPYSPSATNDYLYIRVPDFGLGTQTFSSGCPVFNVYGGTPALISFPTFGNSGPSEAMEFTAPSFAYQLISFALTIVYCGIDSNNLGNFRVSGQVVYSFA